MSALFVLNCASGASLQDAGRFGYQRFGVGVCGAFNDEYLLIANALVGNKAGTACLEFLLIGARFQYNGAPRLVALAGNADLRVNGVVVPVLQSYSLQNDDIIEVGGVKQGVSAMLALQGGFDLPQSLGSLSYHARGLLGIALKPSQILPLFEVSEIEACALLPFPALFGDIRVVLGPQDDYITPKGIETFLNNDYVVSKEADRMGFRLEGAKIEHGALGFNIVSDGIATGSIQVPGSGEPIVMMKDRQTTGGYPKIATIISIDLPRFSQVAVGKSVRFTAISQEEAIAAAKARHSELQAWVATRKPLKRELTSEFLLSLNLVDGFIA